MQEIMSLEIKAHIVTTSLLLLDCLNVVIIVCLKGFEPHLTGTNCLEITFII